MWLTFSLGRRLAGPVEGVLASLLLATSPAILSNVMFPMSDIPAMTFWALAVVLVMSEGRFSPLLAGLAASVAVLIRPNVVPLAIVPGLAAMFRPRAEPARLGSVLRDGALFAAGIAPGILVVALVNTRLYGSPLESGYGPLAMIFDASRSLANITRWAAWLWDTQPVVAVLAPLGLILPGALARRGAALLGGIIATTIVCYLFYEPFDAWWFLRFLFPMFPALMILAAAGLTYLARRLPRSWRVPIAAACVAAAVSSQVRTGQDRSVYGMREAANRSLEAVREIGRLVPENAMVICVQESGTLRYYANRLTLRWDWLPPEWLDRAIDQLQAKGIPPLHLPARGRAPAVP